MRIMRIILSVLLAMAVGVFAKERKVTETVIKPDTIVSFKTDTIKTVNYDTLKITKVYNDTAVLLKADTVKAPQKKPAVKK
jgi:lipopolysaccharide export system protein LptC